MSDLLRESVENTGFMKKRKQSQVNEAMDDPNTIGVSFGTDEKAMKAYLTTLNKVLNLGVPPENISSSVASADDIDTWLEMDPWGSADDVIEAAKKLDVARSFSFLDGNHADIAETPVEDLDLTDIQFYVAFDAPFMKGFMVWLAKQFGGMNLSDSPSLFTVSSYGGYDDPFVMDVSVKGDEQRAQIIDAIEAASKAGFPVSVENMGLMKERKRRPVREKYDPDDEIGALGSCQYNDIADELTFLLQTDPDPKKPVTDVEYDEAGAFKPPKQKASLQDALKTIGEILLEQYNEEDYDEEDVEAAREFVPKMKILDDYFEFCRNDAWDLWSALPDAIEACYPSVTDPPEGGSEAGYFCWLMLKDGFVKSPDAFADFDT